MTEVENELCLRVANLEKMVYILLGIQAPMLLETAVSLGVV